MTLKSESRKRVYQQATPIAFQTSCLCNLPQPEFGFTIAYNVVRPTHPPRPSQQVRSSLSHKISEKNQISRCLGQNVNTLQQKALSRLSAEMYLSREPCSTHLLQESFNITSATQLRPMGTWERLECKHMAWTRCLSHRGQPVEAVSKSIAHNWLLLDQNESTIHACTPKSQIIRLNC